MSVNGVTSDLASAYTSNTAAAGKKETAGTGAASRSKAQDSGVVYEPSQQATESDKTKTSDYSATIKKMKLELASKNQQLENLVSQMLGKQAKKFTTLADFYKNLDVDPQTIKQAQEDVSEDGYWGVEKTSDRLVEMAKALSGGDPTKADELIAAMKKGYDQATKAWGEKLPDISRKTIDAATEKLNKWRDGLDVTTEA